MPGFRRWGRLVLDEAAELEVPLSGGRMTRGVVRVGGTVRRPVSPASRFAAMLLSHLASLGFEGAPKYLGEDGAGCARS